MRTPSTTASDFDSCRGGTERARLDGLSLSACARLACLLAALVVSFFAFSASSAFGAYLHTTVIGEYGKEGPKASGLGGGCRIAWQASTQRLYLMAEGKIFGLQRTGPGSVTPLAGFPINVTGNSGCGDPDLAVDNSATASAGNLYTTPSFPATIYAFSSTGSSLGSINVGSGENCGVAVGNDGNVWGGYYGGGSAKRFTPAGSLVATVPLGFAPCKVEIDQTNNDLFAHQYASSTTTKFTAESGYTTKLSIPTSGGGNPGLAVNGLANRLYVANGGSLKSYDTESATLVETVSVASGATDVAVDEATDTVFAVAGGAIKEISGAVVPDVTTEGPEGNSKVNGKVETAGGGPITECYFEWGNAGGPPGSYTLGKEFCSPATPYAGPTQVVSANLPSLFGEQTYHYRLVAGNANGKNFGGDQTITPHYVEGLVTDNAENVARTTAKLKAHFTGNGEETKYYFEWGTANCASNPCTQSAVPPGPSIGSPVGPTNLEYDASGLLPDTLYHYRVVASNPLGVSPGSDKTFKTLPAVQALTTGAATNIAPKSATLNASYNGDGTATTYYYEYGTSAPGYGSTTTPVNVGTPSGATPLPANISGLALETLYHYRIVATNGLGTTKGADQTFTTKKAVIDLTTLPATEISQDGVQLNAEYQGAGDDTQYYFEYGHTTQYDMVSQVPPGSTEPGSAGPTSVSTEIGEFEGWTTYHYRAVASNSLGTSYGQDETFTTLPAPLPGVDEVEASDVTSTTAKLSAQINPNRWATVYRFEWGPTTSYGSTTALDDVIGGLDNESQPVSNEIASLTPATVYHFRVIAINFSGVTYGEDHSFVTPDVPVIESTTASSVTQASAHLAARVVGNASPTQAYFEYGPTAAYGSSTAPSDIGEELVARDVAADIAGLDPSKTYHFRVVAGNGVGVAYGPDRTLTTIRPPEESGGEDCESTSQRAKKLNERAAQLRQRAGETEDTEQARRLRQRAKSVAKKARKLSKQAAACRLGEGGGAR
jgi:hypothetical protein